jgi:hypothetical protein
MFFRIYLEYYSVVIRIKVVLVIVGFFESRLSGELDIGMPLFINTFIVFAIDRS